MVEPTRRTILASNGGSIAVAGNESKLSWAFCFPSIGDGTLNFADFRGRVLLVANTASFCGYTDQYEGLEKPHRAKPSAGLTVAGVPSRDFNQKSPDDATVKAFCETGFAIDFPLTTVSHVTGPSAAPFYDWVKAEMQWQPQWNFCKVLIGRDGRVAATFGSDDEPDGGALLHALDAALARSV